MFKISEPCHDALGLEFGSLPSGQIHASSTESDNSVDNIRLNSLRDENGFVGWTPDPSDGDPSVTFDLGHVLQVTGLVLQGGGEDGSGFVETFRVSFSVDNETYVNVSSEMNSLVRCMTIILKSLTAIKMISFVYWQKYFKHFSVKFLLHYANYVWLFFFGGGGFDQWRYILLFVSTQQNQH